jgi:hypothetical protein
MASETGVDDELLAMVGFGEFEEEDALIRREQGQQLINTVKKLSKGESRGSDRGILTEERSYIFETRKPVRAALSSREMTFTSKDENLCFILEWAFLPVSPISSTPSVSTGVLPFPNAKHTTVIPSDR